MTREGARIVLILTLLAFAVRLGALFGYRAHVSPELWEVEEIATNLLGGKGFVYHHFKTDYRSYMEPLYPLLTYVVYALTRHSFLAMGVVNVLLSAALIPVVYTIGRWTCGPQAGLWAGFLVAVDPGLIRYAVKFHPLVLDTLLTTLVVLVVLRARREPRASAYCLIGVTAGLSVLTRPTVLPFLPFALLWLFVTSSRSVARRTALIGLALAAVALVVAPWVIRNYTVHHRFVLTRTGAPFVFWLGNHPGWSGSALDRSGQSLFPAASPEFREQVLRADELRQGDLFWQDAVTFVRDNPVAFLGRIATKFVYFWGFSPQFGLQYREEPVWIYRTFYIVAALFAVMGVLVVVSGTGAGMDRRECALLLAFLLSISLFQSTFYVEGRHRLAVEPIFLVFSAVGIVGSFPGRMRMSL